MNKPKIIVLADIASLRVTCNGFKDIVKGLETKFEVVACKFYSYVAKRNRDFNEYISAFGYETELPSASRRRNKLDSKQVMDATLIAQLGKIDAVAMITGEGDILPVVNLLKSRGIDIYDINVQEGKYTYAFTGFIPVATSALREGYTAPATKKVVKKIPKPVVAPQRTEPRAENRFVEEAKSILSGSDILSRYRK